MIFQMAETEELQNLSKMITKLQEVNIQAGKRTTADKIETSLNSPNSETPDKMSSKK